MQKPTDLDLLTCRTYGHPWQPTQVIRTRAVDTRVVQYTSVLVCPRCTTERRQVISATGELVRNGYTYVDGYLQHGEDRLDKQDYRIAYLRSVPVVDA